jgi:4a-hydroxytetrahydrobiopterin dehydratase
MQRNEWKEVDSKLFKKFIFENFVDSLKFVNRVGELAENAGHHPDITFSWGYVEISLFTHSENAITDKDYDLAAQIDSI